jgi:hypothetical protein
MMSGDLSRAAEFMPVLLRARRRRPSDKSRDTRHTHLMTVPVERAVYVPCERLLSGAREAAARERLLRTCCLGRER